MGKLIWTFLQLFAANSLKEVGLTDVFIISSRTYLHVLTVLRLISRVYATVTFVGLIYFYFTCASKKSEMIKSVRWNFKEKAEIYRDIKAENAFVMEKFFHLFPCVCVLHPKL